MQLVPTAAAFNEHLGRAKTILDTVAFPKSVFRVPPISKAFFDWGYLTGRDLFQTLLYLCKVNDERGFVFLMVDPDPIGYFHRHFGWFPAAWFSSSDNPDDFVEFVRRDPGSSPADAIAYRSDEIVVISDAQSFAVYGHRKCEFAVIGTFKRPVDFEAYSNANFPKGLQFMNSTERAYEYLKWYARYTGFTLERDEFVCSWEPC